MLILQKAIKVLSKTSHLGLANYWELLVIIISLINSFNCFYNHKFTDTLSGAIRNSVAVGQYLLNCDSSLPKDIRKMKSLRLCFIAILVD